MVSFIISVDSSYAMTNNFFSLFLENKFVKSNEVIVVLDGVNNLSIISYCKNLEKKYSNLYVHAIDKVGYGKANNYAVKKSTGEYLFFINNDIFAEEDCFQKMYSKLATGKVDCVQPLLIYPQTNLVQSAGTFFGPYYKEHLFEGNKINSNIVQIEGQRQALTSALYAMKRETFEFIGGFDEFYYNKLESFELSYKLTLLGKICWYLPSARAWHSRGGGRKQYTFDFTQQEAYFWTRFGPKVQPDISIYLSKQLTSEMLSLSYYTIIISQLRSWKNILKQISLKSTQCIELPWIAPTSFNLWDILPNEFLQYEEPIALVVESITYLKDNIYWFNLRNNPYDIAIDRYANIVNISHYINDK